jgi:Ser/Thr protein kinase RdoA (MazF antagonist)
LAPDFGLLSSALLEGYVQHRPLAERDLELLPVFLLIRGMAIIGWFHQRPEHTGSSFFEELKTWVLEACDSTPVRLERL